MAALHDGAPFGWQGLTEEEVAEAANAAAAEAQQSSDLMRASRAAGGDAQSRYYSLAHR